ncbi:MAG: vanadium-dependent haloperoxidase [Saprospiraceae bacterium]
MKAFKVQFLLILAMSVNLFTSCSEDDFLLDTNNISTTSLAPTTDDTLEEINNTLVNGNPPDMRNIDNRLALSWTTLLLELERYAAGMRPNASARALAYIHLATYETIAPGMPDYMSNANRLRGLDIRNGNNNGNRPSLLDWQIALNATYADVLEHFLLNVPAERKTQIAALEAQIERQLTRNAPRGVVEDSKEWGAYVAEQVIRYSRSDQAAEQQVPEPQPTSYEPPTGEGYWTYSADPERALFPYWGSVRTFVISPDETTTVDPLAYNENSNSPYFEQMMEVYNVNNAAKTGDEEQLWIAEFWSDDVEGVMMSPPARQLSIAQQLVEQNELNLAETMALFVKLGFALNDAAVSTWKYKYEHMVMRPNVFIHEFIDPDFQTNLYRLVYWPNPSFPGYPSGHSCFASAAAGVFIDAFGDAIDFTDRTHEGRTEFLGEPRRFGSFTEMAEENGYSRIPLGVHVRMDCTEGLRLGYEISDAVNDLRLQRRENL